MIHKYADPERLVYARADFDDQLSMLHAVRLEAKDSRPVEVRVQCSVHQGVGVIAVYEDGLMVFACNECHQLIGQVEVAEVARPWGKARLVD